MPTNEEVDSTITAYLELLAWQRFANVPQVITTLRAIPELRRRLLALKGYLRVERDPGAVARKWAWSEQEYEDFQGSAEQTALRTEIRSVARRFADASPGYELSTGGEFRSFETQLRFWNARDNVAAVGDEVLKKVRAFMKKRMSDPAFPTLKGIMDVPQLVSGQIAILLLQGVLPTPLLPLWVGVATEAIKLREELALFEKTLGNASHSELRTATPGVSDHGQARAIDFVVWRLEGGRRKEMVVGASSAATWRSTGFAERLRTAMASSARFEGPLRTPDEPWHYNYRPE